MNPNLAHDARAEELSDIQVGMTLASFYEDDTVWHERLVVWPSMEDPLGWYILTPDLDLYVEKYDLDASTGPKRVRMRGVTFRFWSRFREPVYRFRSDVTDEDFKKYIQKAIEEIKKDGRWNDALVPKNLWDRSGKEVSATAYLGLILVRRRVRAKGLGVVHPGPHLPPELEEGFHPELLDKIQPVSPAPEGFVWISEETKGGKKLGEELDVLRGHGVSIDQSVALVQFKGDYIKGKLLRVEDVPSYVEELRSRYKAPALPAELSADLVNREGAEDPKDVQEEKTTEDARVLAIDYDSQGERYKEWKLVSQECEEYSFKDWPFEGPLCTLHMVKQMQRSGGSPKQWLQAWARAKQVPEGDRIMFELRTLIEALEFGGSYDQLNLSSLAAFECLARRIAAIVDAFSAGSSNSPDWGAARIYTNYRGPEDVVMPQLKQWASKKGKEEIELHQARTKIREGRRGLVVDESAAEALAEGALPSAVAPKRKGKKGGGRGLAPPAPES